MNLDFLKKCKLTKHRLDIGLRLPVSWEVGVIKSETCQYCTQSTRPSARAREDAFGGSCLGGTLNRALAFGLDIECGRMNSRERQ